MRHFICYRNHRTLLWGNLRKHWWKPFDPPPPASLRSSYRSGMLISRGPREAHVDPKISTVERFQGKFRRIGGDGSIQLRHGYQKRGRTAIRQSDSQEVPPKGKSSNRKTDVTRCHKATLYMAIPSSYQAQINHQAR